MRYFKGGPMFWRKTQSILEPDVFDVLSATWVLACNDENHIVTYEGLRYRLGVHAGLEVRALVKKRIDLFRLRIPPSQLENWKNAMREGKRRPVWIAQLPKADQQ